MSATCEFCGSISSNRFHIGRHQQSETCRRVQSILNKQLGQKDAEIAEVQRAKTEADTIISKLQLELNLTKAAHEELKKLMEKAVLKPTTINQNRITRTTNNLAYISTEPINFKALKDEMPKLITVEALMTNDRKFNGMLTSALLQDEKGYNKVLCTDMARKQFQYKDELSGELVSDPYLERLRERMRSGVNYRQLHAELVEYLDSMGGDTSDNPCQAAIMKRAKLGDKFVSHVAKNTYKGSVIEFDDN